MDFLGNQSNEIRKMKAQLLALEALNLALIEALRPELREQLEKRFECYSEKMKTQMLNSMATDELYGRLLESLDCYQQSLKQTSD
ncbi:hypothetical protein CLU84_2322 [Comamonas sp. 26]|nr:hypothetical protein CLU84_2322 [Comamonas sp. 26]